jgi:hypothetical protein
MNMNREYKKYPSEYILQNVVWNGIEYDKHKLISFIKRYEELKTPFASKEEREELKILDKILSTHNVSNLEKLLNNDEVYSRWATIEKWARVASIEILLEQKYSKDTFTVISNLPIADYKLVIRRCKELVRIISDVTTEAEADTSTIPGVK